jgi:hypothetical protein
VGLYLNPPEHAIVMCVDEKSQIQALDRTQPGLPLKRGRCGTMTHDYKRNGTATLFAALNVADGTVISMCDDRHRHQEWLQFLRVIDQVTPAGKTLHLIADNYATHSTCQIGLFLRRSNSRRMPARSCHLIALWASDQVRKAAHGLTCFCLIKIGF